MALTVTATASGAGSANGIELAVRVLNGASLTQAGAAANSATVTTPQLAVTPGASGNWVYGCVGTGGSATAFSSLDADTTSVAASTVVSGGYWGMYRSTSGTTTSSTTYGWAAPTATSGNYFAACAEIQASGTLSEDSSTPAVASTSGAATVTSASFTPPGTSILVATVLAQWSGTGAVSVALSDSAGAYNWTQLSATPTEALASVWVGIPVSGGTAGFAAVGGLGSATASGFTLTTGAADGKDHFVLLWVTSETVADYATAVSSSNIAWDPAPAVPHTPFTNNPVVQTVFKGKVTSASAGAAVTVSLSAGSPTMRIAWREFSTAAGYGALVLEALGTTDTASGGAMPPVTPVHAGCLYAGYVYDDGTGVAGTTAGYVYALDANTNQFAYNLSCTGSPQSPNIGDTGGTSGIGVMMYQAVNTPPPRPALVPPGSRSPMSMRALQVPPLPPGPVTLPGAVSLSGSGTVTPTGNGRSQYTWPFTYDSIWNLPVSASATYAPSGITVTSDYSTDPSAVEYCCTDPAQPVKSLLNAELSGGGTGAVNVYVAPGMSAPGTWNDCAALLGTDNDTVYQGQTLELTAGGNPQFGGDADAPSATVSITGEGITGAHGGSGLSALGGTLTVADLTGSGPISHAMKVCFNGYEYYSSAGAGYQWPAISADGGYNVPADVNYYGGSNPDVILGALLALPPFIVPSSRYSDPLVQRIATAMQCYGCYIVDNTASGPGVSDSIIEINYDAVSYFTGTGTFSSDLHQMLEDLQVITSSTSSTPGGGAIGSDRFAPYAPPFNNGTDVPPSVTVVTPESVLMESLQDAFPGSTLNAQWGSYGTVTVAANQAAVASGTSESGIYSVSGYMLTGSYMLAKVTPYTGGTGGYTYFQAITETGSGGAGIQYNSGSIWAYWISSSGAVTSLATLTYDPVNHAWWRIRESGGTTYFDTAPDGLVWTNRWSVADPIIYNSMEAQLGTAISGGTAGTTYLTDFNLPSAAGAVSLAGTGILGAAGQAAVPGAASLAGLGTASAAGHKSIPGAASFVGIGSLTASGTGTVSAAAALTGSGTAGAAGQKTVPGAAPLAGSGTTGAAGGLAGSAPMAGLGSLGAAGQKTVPGAAPLAGLGAVTPDGQKTVPGAASFSGIGSFGAAGHKTVPGAAPLAGTGLATAAGQKTVPGSASLAGLGTAAVAGQKTVPGAVSAAGTGTLTAAEHKTVPGAAPLGGAGSLSGAGETVRPGAAALAGAGIFSATSGGFLPGAAALAGAGTAGAAGQKTVPGTAALSGSGTAAAAARVTYSASAPLAGAGTLAAAWTFTQQAAAPLGGLGTASASPSGFVPGAAPLAGAGTLGAGAVRTAHAVAALAAQAELAAQARLTREASASLASGAVLSPHAVVGRPGSAALTAPGTVSAPGLVTEKAAFAGSAHGTLGAAAVRTAVARGALAASAALTAHGTIARPGTAYFTAAPVVTAAGVIPQRGTAALGAHPVLFASAFNRLGTASLSSTAALSCSATAGPDLEALWAAYQKARLAENRAFEIWRMMHQAGGTDGTAGFLYAKAYEAERQADLAYKAFQAAQRRVFTGVTG